MLKDKIIAGVMIVADIFLIIAGMDGTGVRSALAVAGAILIGSWYVGRSIGRR